jgi:phosphonate transport system substrate-binding protein
MFLSSKFDGGIMVRLGGSATRSHMDAFQGLEEHFRNQGVDLEWVLYSDYDAMVEAFVAGEIDLAWNGPLGYVKIKQRLADPCHVIAMRDVDQNFITHFVTQSRSEIATVEDLKGRRFAFGRRGSEHTGLLPHYFLKQLGIDPKVDLESCSFYEDRETTTRNDELDVVQRVCDGEFDAGPVSDRALEGMLADGTILREAIRIFWSSPGYSHCCFTAQRGLEPKLYQQVEAAFLSVTAEDAAGKMVLEAEACSSLVTGVYEGWEMLEKAATEEGLI